MKFSWKTETLYPGDTVIKCMLCTALNIVLWDFTEILILSNYGNFFHAILIYFKAGNNSAGIRTNWINCLLYNVLLNLHVFPVLNIYCTEPYLGQLQRSYIYLYWQSHGLLILIKIIIQFFECKIPERGVEQYQYVEFFQAGFHTGLKPRWAACLSLQFSRFEYSRYDI